MIRKTDHFWGILASFALHILLVYLAVVFIRTNIAPPEDKTSTFTCVPLPPGLLTDPLPDIDKPVIGKTPANPLPDPDVWGEDEIAGIIDDSFEPDFILPQDMSILPSPGIALVGIPFPTRTEEGRTRMLQQYGDAEKSALIEGSVVRSLRWLKDHQAEDGSWGESSKAGITGLALLAFLAHGETMSSQTYGVTIQQAIDFLLRIQDAEGNFGVRGFSDNHNYSHAIATYALAEATAMNPAPSLREAVQRGVHVILQGINLRQVEPKGSQKPVNAGSLAGNKISAGFWNYNYTYEGGRWDTSFSGWQIQALKAAQLAGCGTFELSQAMDAAANGLKEMYHRENSQFAYSASWLQGGEPSWHGDTTMTAVGLLCLQILGEGAALEADAAVSQVEQEFCDWSNAPPNCMYRWYYLTQAMFHKGGTSWKHWERQFRTAYLDNQKEDGSWESPKGDNATGRGLPYTTALGALTLQVYYRHSQLYTEQALVKVETTSPFLDDDVMVDVM